MSFNRIIKGYSLFELMLSLSLAIFIISITTHLYLNLDRIVRQYNEMLKLQYDAASIQGLFFTEIKKATASKSFPNFFRLIVNEEMLYVRYIDFIEEEVKIVDEKTLLANQGINQKLDWVVSDGVSVRKVFIKSIRKSNSKFIIHLNEVIKIIRENPTLFSSGFNANKPLMLGSIIDHQFYVKSTRRVKKGESTTALFIHDQQGEQEIVDNVSSVRFYQEKRGIKIHLILQAAGGSKKSYQYVSI